MAEGGQPRDDGLLVTHLGGHHQAAQGHQVQLGLPDVVTRHEQVQVPDNIVMVISQLEGWRIT